MSIYDSERRVKKDSRNENAGTKGFLVKESKASDTVGFSPIIHWAVPTVGQVPPPENAPVARC